MVSYMTFRQFVKPKIALITLRFFISKKKTFEEIAVRLFDEHLV